MAQDRSRKHPRLRGKPGNPKAPSAEPSYAEASFWPDVERESHVDQIDWYDLALFLSADQLPTEPRPEFVDELREHLRERVRRRYAS